MDGEVVAFHCFNCGFTCTYYPGGPLYPKFLKFLDWMGVDATTISQLKLEALKVSPTNEESNVQPRKIESIELPDCRMLIDDPKRYSRHVDYLASRGITIDDFPFLVSDDILYRTRVILPFILQDTIIGYSARSIVPSDKNRFIMRQTTDFVFGLDFLKPKHEWVILSEGLFDALSVKGLATMHNEISEAQVNLIHDLHRRIIVVPDYDMAGMSKAKNSLIETALDNNWDVAFPEWDHKDINSAYVEYGRLFVMRHLLNVSTTNSMTIKLKQKMMMGKLRRAETNGIDQK